MTASDLLNGMRTHGALAVHALEKQGVRVIRVELDRCGFMVVQGSSLSVKQAVKALGPFDVSRRTDDLYPFEVTWKVTPAITVFALVNARQAWELGLMAEEAPAAATTGA